MTGIQKLLSVLRRLILGNFFVRASIRGLLRLFSALQRIITGKRPDATSNSEEGSTTIHIVYPPITCRSDGDGSYPREPESQVVLASSMPPTLHPYSSAGPSASRSSQDITAHPIIQESYSLHGPSVEHLPYQRPPPAAVSMQNLPVLSFSPNLGLNDYMLPSNDSNSAVDLPLPGPATTEYPIHSRPSSVTEDTAESCPPCLSEAHPRICPITPDLIGRYSQKVPIPNEPTKFTLKPLTIRLDQTPRNPPPPCWTPCQHPEGARYFFHEEKRVFTDANLFNADTLTLLNDDMCTVFDFLQAHNVELEPGFDLVLDEFFYDDGSRGCQYYFVNHQDRCVFWMDNVESKWFPMTEKVKGISSASHIFRELEAQYWLHCEYYPMTFEVTHAVVDELRDIVLYAFGGKSSIATASLSQCMPPDAVTSLGSIVSWKIDDLKNMITLLDNMPPYVGEHANKNFSGSAVLVGRLMNATVVLNANVAFLAIQSVDNNGAIAPNRSPAQISSYLSILASIGSIVVGLLLTNYHRGRASGAHAAKFILHHTHPTFGHEARAVLYSLPYALLIWSMVGFMAAFSFMCFTQANLLCRILVAGVWIAVAVLILWCIFHTWNTNWEWLGLLTWMSRLGASVEEEAASELSKEDHPQNGAKSSMSSESRQKKRWWTVTWESIVGTLRKGFWHSEPIVTNV
ncbi:hypothetical protein R3P38DRAFT_3537281 [Favolaschia claudopus]|uniref:Uncharacterized protein n=1 Tax=Favolaschia claudopus TaxID=2862362 RepID=A0AAW0BBS7_9AGAR